VCALELRILQGRGFINIYSCVQEYQANIDKFRLIASPTKDLISRNVQFNKLV